MKSLKQTIGISLLLITLLTSGSVFAQKRGNSGSKLKTERGLSKERVNSNRYRYNDRYRTQPIRRGSHYRYPVHRRVVRTLHRNHISIVYGGLNYFYYSGIFYTLHGNDYVVVLPPRGFRITILPVGHVRIVVGPSVYYYHSGVYYTESNVESMENEGKYEVTLPPVGVVMNEIHEDSNEVIIDGKVLYEYNDILYKKNIDINGNTTFEVVYNKTNN